MAYTVAELNAIVRTLEDAWVRGIKSVTFADRSTFYIEQYQERIAYFKGLINQLSAKPKQTLAVATKGF